MNPIQLTAAEFARKKLEKTIYIFLITIKDRIIPIVKKSIHDQAKLWKELKIGFQSGAIGKQLVLKEKLSEIHLFEGMNIELYITWGDRLPSYAS